MARLFRTALLTAALSFGLASSAVAATLTYSVNGPVVPGISVSFDSITPNTGNLYPHPAYTLPGVGKLKYENADIVTGNDTFGILQSKEPWYTNGHNYLSVYGKNIFSLYEAGEAVFTLNKGFDTFSFDWGSVDEYNTITVIDRKNHKTVISGKDVLNAYSFIDAGKSTVWFSLTDLDGIKQVILTSCKNAFEIANIRVGNVPLPAALPLFGMALAGLTIVRRRQKA